MGTHFARMVITMKPEDIKVGGLYTWRKDFDYYLEFGLDYPPGDPFLITSIKAVASELDDDGYLECIGPCGLSQYWGLGIAFAYWKPFRGTSANNKKEKK